MRYFLGCAGFVAGLIVLLFAFLAWQNWRMSDGPRDLALASLEIVDADAVPPPVLRLDFTSRVDLESYVHLHGLNIKRETSPCRDAQIEESSRVTAVASVYDQFGEINSAAENYDHGTPALPRPQTSGPADSANLFHYRVYLPVRYEKSGRRFDLEKQDGNLCLRIVALSERLDPHFKSNVVVIPAARVSDALRRAR